jgi:hypothetical protein
VVGHARGHCSSGGRSRALEEHTEGSIAHAADGIEGAREGTHPAGHQSHRQGPLVMAQGREAINGDHEEGERRRWRDFAYALAGVEQLVAIEDARDPALEGGAAVRLALGERQGASSDVAGNEPEVHRRVVRAHVFFSLTL